MGPFFKKHLFVFSILSAFLIHIFILIFFRFYLQMPTQPNKPSFVFLGPILSDIKPKDKKNFKNTSIQSIKKLPQISSEKEKKKQYDAQINKPILKNAQLSVTTKETIKSTFEITTDDNVQPSTAPLDIGIDVTTHSYKPLRLHTNDQN